MFEGRVFWGWCGAHFDNVSHSVDNSLPRNAWISNLQKLAASVPYTGENGLLPQAKNSPGAKLERISRLINN